MEGCGNRVNVQIYLRKYEIYLRKYEFCLWHHTYMLSLLMFVDQNKFFYRSNENHNLDTRQRNNLYHPQTNLNIYQKEVYYSGIKIFNNLTLEIKNFFVTPKKLLCKNVYTLIYFTLWKSNLLNCELSTVSQDLCYSGTLI